MSININQLDENYDIVLPKRERMGGNGSFGKKKTTIVNPDTNLPTETYVIAPFNADGTPKRLGNYKNKRPKDLKNFYESIRKYSAAVELVEEEVEEEVEEDSKVLIAEPAEEELDDDYENYGKSYPKHIPMKNRNKTADKLEESHVKDDVRYDFRKKANGNKARKAFWDNAVAYEQQVQAKEIVTLHEVVAKNETGTVAQEPVVQYNVNSTEFTDILNAKYEKIVKKIKKSLASEGIDVTTSTIRGAVSYVSSTNPDLNEAQIALLVEANFENEAAQKAEMQDNIEKVKAILAENGIKASDARIARSIESVAADCDAKWVAEAAAARIINFERCL